MENLDDLYQELCITKRNIKSSNIKSKVSVLLALVGVVNPFFLIMALPAIGYLIHEGHNYKKLYSGIKVILSEKIKFYEEFVSLDASYKFLLIELKESIVNKMDLI